MATRDSGGQQHTNRRADEADEVTTEDNDASDLKERHEKLSEDVDSLLDEIDDVLEENAEEFVKGYVQKGGE
ncbi:ubiquitin-like protein Pup [Frankia sp. QA3]|uniref:ubiquitin-like protein Pup n=1 Tax=Frankia sp. QA3 TaxID=710111 RepID=UPI000269BD98|nr:ubiquitin-like protein Pup [Frankia sp. QA3]EIV91391.1 ubiquitin-like protein Pup [Frankia sp. QA3]